MNEYLKTLKNFCVCEREINSSIIIFILLLLLNCDYFTSEEHLKEYVIQSVCDLHFMKSGDNFWLTFDHFWSN